MNLREIRKAKGYTIAEFAELLEISQNRLICLECGIRATPATIHRYETFAAYLPKKKGE